MNITGRQKIIYWDKIAYEFGKFCIIYLGQNSFKKDFGLVNIAKSTKSCNFKRKIDIIFNQK